MLRSLYALAIQVLGAGSGAVLPFAVIFLFEPDGFRRFAAGYVFYSIALLVGTVGLDIALARLGFAIWRSATLLAFTTATATSLLLLGAENSLTDQIRLAVVLATACGAASSYLVNKAYYLGDSATIARIGYIKIGAALVGVVLLALSGDPVAGIFCILAQNALVLASTAYVLKILNVQIAAPLSLFKIPQHLGHAVYSFLTFSFTGLLQAYERFLVARIDHAGVATYLTLSMLLSILTYFGIGVERTEYSKVQDLHRIQRTLRRLLLWSLPLGIAIAGYIYWRQSQPTSTAISAVLIYSLLAAVLHTAFYFSSAALLFKKYKPSDIRSQAHSNVLQAIVPLVLLTGSVVLIPFSPVVALALVGVTIPTILWWTSLLRLKRALSRSETQQFCQS
jgi:hypothetical protein